MRVLHGDFERGLAITGIVGGLLIVALYTVAAPTTDIRARIPFLLEMKGGILGLHALAIFLLSGVVSALITQRVTLGLIRGVVLGAVANLLVLESGLLPLIMPPFHRASVGWGVFAAAFALALVLLARQRRHVHDAKRRSER